MIHTANQMKTEFRDNMRGGQGTIKITHLFTPEELKGKCRLCARILIEPGDSIGFHDHQNEEEVYILTKGTAFVNDDGVERELVAGDAILTGGGKGHAIKNIGKEPLELIAVILLYQ
jgi:mannose-6-phosphate isomerase-like protein (cupin superfamily)